MQHLRGREKSRGIPGLSWIVGAFMFSVVFGIVDIVVAVDCTVLVCW